MVLARLFENNRFALVAVRFVELDDFARSEAFAMFLATQGDPVSAAVTANRKSAPHGSVVTAMRRSAWRHPSIGFCGDNVAENRSVVSYGTRSSF